MRWLARLGLIICYPDTHNEPGGSGSRDAEAVDQSAAADDAHTGWVVGGHGAMLQVGPPICAPLIKNFEVLSDSLDELDVSLRVKPDRGADITAAHVWARLRVEAESTSLGTVTKSHDGPDGSQLWHVTWKPSERIGAHTGDSIEYQVRLDDGGRQFDISLGKFTYDPSWAVLWRQNRAAVITALSAFGILLIYAGTFGFVLWLAPARLASAGGAPGLDADIKLEGWVALV